ncbi:hypothetical protein FK85_13430 [Halorubrum saccharovorum]|uniref:DUF7998 domain-containing protein n=1 Tax=Halorubrum saccharovorum TaxID=2248 RepID=A0A081ESX2_9EURY|nr:hypothetical protein [Halorubrum saccharovorum]KDS90510.1 hypothetical protein FK85_13430 [Halorubrum saccharovorum]
MSFLGGSEPQFDPADAFVPEHVPEPGAFLAGHDVLDGRDHVALHRTVADAFEEHGVYDATFGYNLARLNRDPRHTDAGFRYAEDADDPTTLRAEFTPTTAFCPQAEPLAVGAFRALDAVDTHGYDLVRVRVDASLDGSDAVNERLAKMETGEIEPEPADGGGLAGGGVASGDRGDSASDPSAPF